MLKTIATASVCTIAYVNAIKLTSTAQSEAAYLLDDTSAWTTDETAVNAVIGSGNQYSDPDFKPDSDSLGTGTSATGWKRLSDLYGSDMVMFAGTETWSTMKQGSLGDCYLLSTLAALDARPGALEDLFVTKEVNAEGIYAVKFSVNGQDVVVHVDDYVPVTTAYRSYDNRANWQGESPAFAHSAHYGEIWPMIAEKAWAKLTGSYAGMEGGDNRTVLSLVTNDPMVKVDLDSSITTTNAAGLAFWAQLKDYSNKEYLMFSGTHSYSWVENHAYTVLEAGEFQVGSAMQKLIKLRNPWGSTKWEASLSTDEANWNAMMTAIQARSEYKEEGGKFWMTLEDFLAQFDIFSAALGAESRTGGTERLEYRPMVPMSSDGGYVRVTLFEDVDLTTDIMAIQALQGGNRIGTDRNPAYQKEQTGYFRYTLNNSDNSFAQSWHGHGVHYNLWVFGDAGNQKVFDSTTASKIPAGDYILAMRTEWSTTNELLKQLQIRVQSHNSVALTVVTANEAAQVLSEGNANLKSQGNSCIAYGSNSLGSGLTLVQATAEAKSRGYSEFIWTASEPDWNAYGCPDSYTEDPYNWSGLMNIYTVNSSPVSIPTVERPADPTPAATNEDAAAAAAAAQAIADASAQAATDAANAAAAAAAQVIADAAAQVIADAAAQAAADAAAATAAEAAQAIEDAAAQAVADAAAATAAEAAASAAAAAAKAIEDAAAQADADAAADTAADQAATDAAAAAAAKAIEDAAAEAAAQAAADAATQAAADAAAEAAAEAAAQAAAEAAAQAAGNTTDTTAADAIAQAVAQAIIAATPVAEAIALVDPAYAAQYLLDVAAEAQAAAEAEFADATNGTTDPVDVPEQTDPNNTPAHQSMDENVDVIKADMLSYWGDYWYTWGSTSYRSFNKDPRMLNGVETNYFCEQDRNDGSEAQWTMTFNTELYEVVSHDAPDGIIRATMSKDETIFMCAKYLTDDTNYSWPFSMDIVVTGN